ncbi:hypothetical protein EJB05_44271, partial [Eragrostis curvula]
METPLLLRSAFVTDLDGAIIILPADVAVELRWRERVAKLVRDLGVALLEEFDTRGWSSAVQERGLALRRRRGAAPCSRLGCGWIVEAAPTPAPAATEEEIGFHRDAAATAGPGEIDFHAPQPHVPHALLGLHRHQPCDLQFKGHVFALAHKLHGFGPAVFDC